jgi:hypothetical protein
VLYLPRSISVRIKRENGIGGHLDSPGCYELPPFIGSSRNTSSTLGTPFADGISSSSYVSLVRVRWTAYCLLLRSDPLLGESPKTPSYSLSPPRAISTTASRFTT